MPLGIKWNFHLTPSRTIVWPALLPPWKRITRSAFSASRSVILPLPSSPHWAPMMTMPAIRSLSLGGVPPRLAVGRRTVVPAFRRLGQRETGLHPAVGAEHRLGIAADLVHARDGAVADLAPQRVVVVVCVDQVGRQQ